MAHEDATVVAPDARADATATRVRRLLVIPAALLVLRAVEATVAAATVGVLRLLSLGDSTARIDITRLAKVEAYPHTATTALATVAMAAALATVLLRPRTVLATFAGIKAFALVAATAITGAFAAGPLPARAGVAVAGAVLVVLLWARVRAGVPRVLDAVGVRHVDGRAADALLVVKISVLVAVIVLLG